MMDQNMHQDLQNLSFLRNYKFLNKVFQFLLPLSVFSILISYYSWFSLFSHCFNPNSSSSPFYILYSTIDRKYLFLFCNAILVLLSTNSGFIGSSSLKIRSQHTYTYSQVNYVVANEFLVQSVVEEGKRSGEEEEDEAKGIFMTNEEVEQEVEEDYNDGNEKRTLIISQVVPEVEGNGQEELNNKFDYFIRKMKAGDGNGSGTLITNEDVEEEEVEEEEEEEKNNLVLIRNEEWEEEEENALLSTEELNKKFDEFIRRMKEEIRFGVQRQTILV